MVDPSEPSTGDVVPEESNRRRWVGPISVLLLVLLYGAVLVLGDVRGQSGSDAGGKAATAKVMADEGRWEPDLGYWAAGVDPAGVHHPIVNTFPRDDGSWVQATSVPFSLASAWLWSWGGAGAAALLPAAGGVLAAASARRLARGLGGTPAAAEVAFWAVGAVGPVGFYATDLWEHAPAAGLVLAFASVLVAPRGRTDAVLAGVAAGAAVVLRAETALVLGGLAVAALVVPDVRRRWTSRPDRVVLGGLGAVLPVVGNALLERAYLGGDLRGDRAANLASGAASQLGGRLRDAALETGGPFADGGALGSISGVVLIVVALALAAVALGRWRAPGPVVRLLVVLLGALYLGRLAQGIGFFPGMAAVSPLAAAGVVAGLRRAGVEAGRQVVALGATISLPLIWILQWQGNHTAQWGGRYLLASGALLVVVGAVAVFEAPVPVASRRGVLALSVLVGAVGLGYHVQRTAEVARAFEVIDALPAGTTVVSTDPNLLREGGAWYRDGRWLTVTDPAADLFGGGGLADALDLDRLVVIVDPAAGPLPEVPDGWEQTGQQALGFPGGDLVVVALQRT